jgi:hypothetical protein
MSSSLRMHFTLYSRDSTHLLLCQLDPSEFSQNNCYVLYKGHQFLVCDFSSGGATLESVRTQDIFTDFFSDFFQFVLENSIMLPLISLERIYSSLLLT